MSSPSFFINRLVVSGDLHCDIKFNHGLNILQAVNSQGNLKGTNKSGKTALVELIQHGLGKEQKSKEKYHFSPIINKIKTLWLEVDANGKVFTIERSLTEIFAQEKIYNNAYIPEIQELPYELVSPGQISSVLLDSFEIPQVSVRLKDGTPFSLTFPLLMKAFVLHQEESFRGILKEIIPEQRRTDIIGFLTKITPQERYALEKEISQIQLKQQELSKYFTSVQDFLQKNGIPSLMEAQARVRDAEEILKNSRKTLIEIQNEIKQQTTAQKPSGAGQVDVLRKRLLETKEETNCIEYEITGLQKELSKLKEVVSSLKVDHSRYQKLQASSIILSTVEFSVCPRCLLEITPEMKLREENSRCSLCNRPLQTTSDTPPRVIKMPQDIQLQIAEAEKLIGNIQEEIKDKNTELNALREQEIELGMSIDRESQVYVSPSLDRILAKSHEISENEVSLAHAKSLLNQAVAINELRKQIDELKKQQATLEDKLREIRKSSKSKLESLRKLYQDILSEIDFPDFRSCTIDSQTLMPDINDQLYIHVGAALKGLATVSYHLAMLSLARIEDTFFPRMLVIDSPAVGDLNEQNHEKLLKYLASLQLSTQNQNTLTSNSDWQIILTTRKIIPELEPFVFKKISAPNNMLLDGNH
jgi:hypothetical protein